MTRWLACLGVCCGLWVAVTASSAPGQRPRGAGSTVKSTSANENRRSSLPRDVRRIKELQADCCQQGEPSDDGDKGKHTETRRKGDGHRSGGRRGIPEHIERRFIYDAVRRTGGPLELLPLLYIPEIQQELELDEQHFKPKLDAYMAEMQKRIDEHRQQAADQPKSERPELFNQHLLEENNRFQKFLDELTESQKDHLIYRFVQARNYRSLSNQLVRDKMGMQDKARSADIRQEIEDIREQTMDETRDRFRRIFDQGGGRTEFEKIVRENQRKMDARIEKKLSDAEHEKFVELRSKTAAEPPEWLIRGLEFPVRPGTSTRPAPRGQPTAKEASPHDSDRD